MKKIDFTMTLEENLILNRTRSDEQYDAVWDQIYARCMGWA